MRVVHLPEPKAIGIVTVLRPSGRSGRGAAKKSRAAARNITRSQAHLFAYFFWRNRKSRSAKQRLQCHCKRGSPVKPDKRADVHPQGVGRIRSAPSSLTAALAIGPYEEWEFWRNRKSRSAKQQLQYCCKRAAPLRPRKEACTADLSCTFVCARQKFRRFLDFTRENGYNPTVLSITVGICPWF